MLVWLALLPTGCAGGGKVDADSVATDTSPETDADIDADTDADTDVDMESPVLSSAEAWCYFHETGEQFYNWYTACTATDPQDTDTLEGGELLVSRDGETVVERRLACNRDTGVCSTSFREDQEGVICTEASAYRFAFVVVDEDGNESDPMEVSGSMQ